MSRVGHVLFWLGLLGVAVLMVYTAAFDAGHGRPRPSPGAGAVAAEVAVFYPERILWDEFRQGVRACVRKTLAGLVDESDNSVTVRTPRYQRTIRFTLHDVRGLRETKDEVRRLSGPLAVVGSSNTVLTVAIAEALRASGGAEPGKGPVLLIPWASSVLAERADRDEGPAALLDINPGRTFRFCPNNQHQADLIVGCLARHDAGRSPRKVVLVVDRHDPYSVDMAASFHRAVERVAPDAEIIERADSLSLPVLHDPWDLPSPAEEALAESVWRDADSLPTGRTTWVLLPLQDAPMQRILVALRRHARRGLRGGDGPLRVVCGDGIGYSKLSPLAGRCPFPVWCSSSASAPAAARAVGQGLSPDTQVPAEIVSALIHCLDLPPDRPATPDALRDALAGLKVAADDPAAMGRALAFRRSGERANGDLGHVLMIRPGSTDVFAVSRRRSGEWGEPEPLARPPVALRP